MFTKLKSFNLENWKSIRQTHLEFDDINVLVGPNGTGKSNIVQFFHMLNMMMTGSLSIFVGRSGGAASLLHYGPKTSLQIVSELTFSSETGVNSYNFRLMHGAPDTLVFGQETVTYKAFSNPGIPWKKEFGAGYKESKLDSQAVAMNQTLSFVRSVLIRCRYFQFHDTSSESFIRSRSRLGENRYLLNNGGNLASVLFKLQTSFPEIYKSIISKVRSVVPAFGDFHLEPDNDFLLLEWVDSHKGEHFGSHQLSDGSIRFLALMTLLSLPKEMAPSVAIIDEPELGLFPSAIDLLVDTIREASTRFQIVLATQSTRLVRYLNPPSLICCSWRKGESEICKMSPSDEFNFMNEYSLGDYMNR